MIIAFLRFSKVQLILFGILTLFLYFLNTQLDLNLYIDLNTMQSILSSFVSIAFPLNISLLFALNFKIVKNPDLFETMTNDVRDTKTQLLFIFYIYIFLIILYVFKFPFPSFLIVKNLKVLAMICFELSFMIYTYIQCLVKYNSWLNKLSEWEIRIKKEESLAIPETLQIKQKLIDIENVLKKSNVESIHSPAKQSPPTDPA